jgi:hypothetical protein
MKARPFGAFFFVLLASLNVSTDTSGALFYSNFTSPGSPGYVAYGSVNGSAGGVRRSTDLGYTGNNMWQLSHVQLNLKMIEGTSTDIHVYLYQELWEPVLAELYASGPVGDQADYSFYPSGLVYLMPNKFYNLVVEPAFVPNTSVWWYYAPERYDGTGKSTFDSFVSDSWSPWETAHTESLTARVYADVVPEPATCALVGLGGLLCVWATRRRTWRR